MSQQVVARARQTPIGAPVGPVGGFGARDEVDPELLALPAPPAGRRLATLALMAFVVVVAVGLALSLRHDVAYRFASSRAVDLGDVTRLDPATLVPNTYVRIAGTPMAAGTVRYRRLLTAETYVIFPLAGQRTVFVQVPASVERSGRTEFAGRLVTFGHLGARMRAVQEYLAARMGMPVTSESFVLLADERPASYGWAVLLVALCALVIALDVVLVLRWFRPRPLDVASVDGESVDVASVDGEG